MLWLDHLIFGNGRGMASPYFDQRLYWLVDTSSGDRKGRNGTLYSFLGGFGAQLYSRQWIHPNAGERRLLAGRTFAPFRSTRRWLRVEVAWTLIDLPKDIDMANAQLRELEASLGAA